MYRMIMWKNGRGGDKKKRKQQLLVQVAFVGTFASGEIAMLCEGPRILKGILQKKA